MRLVGAKNSYIRGPFFFEGAWVGLLGAIVPSIIIYFAYKTVYSSVNPQFEVQGLSLYPVDTFLPLCHWRYVLSRNYYRSTWFSYLNETLS